MGAIPRYTVKKSKIQLAIEICLWAGKVPLIIGSPAVGKSATVHYIAKQDNALLVDIRLAGFQESDINGIPQFVPVFNIIKDGQKVKVGDRTVFTPLDIFKFKQLDTEEDALLKVDEKGEPILNAKGEKQYYDYIYYFLDEYTSAAEEVVAATYSLILDRKIGQYDLLDCCQLILAGNKVTDNAIANDITTAIMSRVVLLEYEPNFNEWCEHFAYENIDYRIIAYLNFRAKSFYNFEGLPNVQFAAPRTWDTCSGIMQEIEQRQISLTDDVSNDLLKGCVGKVADDFILFTKHYLELPSAKEIYDNPSSIQLPSSNDMSKRYALSTLIASVVINNFKSLNKNDEKTKQIMQLVQDLGNEAASVVLKNIIVVVKTAFSNRIIFDVYRKMVKDSDVEVI